MSALTGDNLEKGFNTLISEIYENNKNEFKNNDYLNLGDAVEEIKLKNDSENENKCCKF